MKIISKILILSCCLLCIGAPTSPNIELVQSVPAESAIAHPQLRYAKDVWVEMIGQAQSSLDIAQFYITNKTGEPIEPVIAALQKAGERGVHIRFLVDPTLLGKEKEDDGVAKIRAIPGLELRMIDYKKIAGGVLHAKYWVIDGKKVFIGSQNFDWRSLKHIHEMGILTDDPTVVRQLGGIFAIDWKLAKNPKKSCHCIRKTSPSKNQTIELVSGPSDLLPRGVRYSEAALVDLIR